MILLVDDRPENIFSLKSILDLHGFPTDTALSGEEALKKTLKTKYALIILDVQMPGLDGFEVAEILSGNSSTRDTPIIFLSAVNTDKKFITRGYSSGAIDYIVKPIDPDILLLKVKTFMRLYEQNRELTAMQETLRSEISFRKQAQQQIQEKARQLDGILEALPQIAFTATPEGAIDFVNRNWHLYSASASLFPATHPDDPEIDFFWKKALMTNKPLEMEVRICKQNTQAFRHFLLRSIPVKENNVIVKWVGTFTDIEEQKQAIKKKDEFLTIASHELKTPLTSIKAYVQLLENLITPEQVTKSYVDRTLLQVNKLDNLINDLLDISRIEGGKLNFDLKEIDFEELLQTTVDILQQIYPDYKITRKGNPPAVIMGNAVRLEQVIINYVSNAIKYSPGQKEIHIISELNPSGELYFAVKDFGIGISAEDCKHIFGKFFRVSDTLPHIQGLGIGLYICAEILRRHKATFGVESQEGQGSSFYFALPTVQ